MSNQNTEEDWVLPIDKQLKGVLGQERKWNEDRKKKMKDIQDLLLILAAKKKIEEEKDV